jgi:hypothetical protein
MLAYKICPPRTAVHASGHMVVVMGFAKLPYVIRSIDDEARRCAILGECYCDGIMDGDIVTRGRAEENSSSLYRHLDGLEPGAMRCSERPKKQVIAANVLRIKMPHPLFLRCSLDVSSMLLACSLPYQG